MLGVSQWVSIIRAGGCLLVVLLSHWLWLMHLKTMLCSLLSIHILFKVTTQSHLFGLPHGPMIEDRVVVDKDTSTPCDYPNLTA